MSLNSFNASQIFTPSSVLSFYDAIFKCFHSRVGVFNMTVFSIISILHIPIHVLIIYLGHQQWQRSSTPMSHSDLITYQVVVMELVNIMGCIFCCCGIYADISEFIVIGVHIFPFKLSGEMFFHILTCMEQYLAVVHPVTYLGSRTANMIRIRNVTFGFVWVLCAISMGTPSIVDELSVIVLACCTICCALFFIFFFTISVLCALTKSKPGKGVGDRQRVQQTKLRAFYIIISILGLLLLRSGSNFLIMFRLNSLHVGENTKCGLWLSVFWFCFPSSLVLPLMFLQRAGKLPCFRKNRNSAHVSD